MNRTAHAEKNENLSGSNADRIKCKPAAMTSPILLLSPLIYLDASAPMHVYTSWCLRNVYMVKKAPPSTVYHTGLPYPIVCKTTHGTNTKSPVEGLGTVRNNVVNGTHQQSLYFIPGFLRSAKSTRGVTFSVKYARIR